MAKGNEYLHARLLLAARGIEPEPRTLAGALLEVERDRLIVGFIRGMSRANG